VNDDDGYVPPPSVVAMVRRLSEKFPSVAGLFEEHLRENEGEILPYLVLANIARWYEERVAERGSDPAGFAEAKRVGESISDEYRNGDLDVETAISLGFLEEILSFREGLSAAHIRELPENLRLEVARLLE
jgi:hypothetical protein